MKTLFTAVLLLALTLPVSAQEIIHKKVLSKKMNKEIETVIITPELVKAKRIKPFIYFMATAETLTGLINRIFRILLVKPKNTAQFMYCPMVILIVGM